MSNDKLSEIESATRNIKLAVNTNSRFLEFLRETVPSTLESTVVSVGINSIEIKYFDSTIIAKARVVNSGKVSLDGIMPPSQIEYVFCVERSDDKQQEVFRFYLAGNRLYLDAINSSSICDFMNPYVKDTISIHVIHGLLMTDYYSPK